MKINSEGDSNPLPLGSVPAQHMYIDPMLVDCWAIVADPVVTLGHPEVNIGLYWPII